MTLIACSKIEIEPCDDGTNLYTLADYPIGVAADPGALNFISEYRDIAIEQFNSITPENIFKPELLHPQEDQFAWEQADQLVEFCQEHQKRLHGHTLIWHSQIPGWMQTFAGSNEEWEEMMKVHIQTICAHFKGKVSGWDVVNEAFNEDGSLRQTIWLENIGPSYIEKAFQFAHEADSNALLFYNDYNIAGEERKRNAIVNFMTDLKMRGVAIHGIGMQLHISISYPSERQMEDAMRQISDQGFLVHLSEIDISINPNSRDIEPTERRLQKQANTMVCVLDSYHQIPIDQQYGLTFWGVGDGHSWIPGHFNRVDYPLLFDEAYDPKPVYCALKQSL